MFDDSKLTSIRKDYPILQREIEGHPIVYLDNAATSKAPMCVVKAIEDMYFHHRANVHRGVHTLSGEATDMVEATREKVRAFINAASVEEVVFTRGTTEAINLVAATYGDRLCNGDEIILTTMEHHSNIVASADAKMYSKPQLEIYTDDVKCSHGSATGQLNEEALFYMRSRNPDLADKPRVLAITKCDMIDDELKDGIAVASCHQLWRNQG